MVGLLRHRVLHAGAPPVRWRAPGYRGNRPPISSRPGLRAAWRAQQAETDQRLARRQRRVHADGEDHLPQPRRRPDDSRVRLPAARRRAANGQHPALVWVHENIRGHLYEHYIPFIRQATARGLRRHRAGISRQHRLRQGVLRRHRLRRRRSRRRGARRRPCSSCAIRSSIPTRIGIIGWSHGGMIALLAASSAIRRRFKPRPRSCR